ncbi:bifunctional protein-serine/threonine kinase/phosphatase [Henriciella aquimarina]|uniref:bifunctional protein-serine/threonine kinase/phosphatase n=1 Tax=Henriciella aquimarina TaxID=545261 RepID=UPI001301E7CB|nr:bifunctional protein-serine/threonine kinase/phosphatase [Henriciella aquimarina]
MRIALGGFTCAGGKGENEDAFAARQPEDTRERRLKGVVACVADGLSSAPRASEASQLAVTQFIDDYYAASPGWTVKQAATRSLTALNGWLHAQGRSESGAMATTFTGLIIRSRTAHLVNTGDSRAYLWRGGHLTQLTRDHALRGTGGAVLTAALGAEPHLSMTYEILDLETSDIVVLMSDGVPSALPGDALSAWFEKNETSGDIEMLARELCEAAIKAGAEDNLTVLCARVDALPPANHDEHREILKARAFLPPLKAGQSVDGYTVERVLHAGVRSYVYRVRHRETGDVYVLKAPTEREDESAVIEALAREEWIGQNADSPSVLRAFPSGDTRFLYLLSAPAEGPTLRQWMNDHEEPDLNTVRDILRDLVAGLRPLHRQGIIHRDLKPENVIIRPGGGVTLIDFGSASIAGLEEVAGADGSWTGEGSLNYSAPEYIMGDPATQRADLFSLACMTYEMLAGALPYKRDIAANRIPDTLSAWRYISLRRRRPDLPPFIDSALEAALMPDPAKRTPAFSEFEADMTRPGQLARQRAASPALIERDPLRFWQVISATELLVILVLVAALSG